MCCTDFDTDVSTLSLENYFLANDEWKYDIMPEVLNGKNVADFIDPDIMAKLDELEAEEERLEAAGFYDDEDDLDSDEDAIRTAASAIRDKKAYIRLVNAQKNKLQNRPIIPRTVQTRTLSDMSKKLTASGYDPTNIEARAKVLAKARGLLGDGSGRKRSAGDMDMDDDEEDWQEDDGEMEIDGEGSNKRAKTSLVAKGKRVPGSDRQTLGLKDAEDATKAVKLKQLYQCVLLSSITSLRIVTYASLVSTDERCLERPRQEKEIETSRPRCPNICTFHIP